MLQLEVPASLNPIVRFADIEMGVSSTNGSFDEACYGGELQWIASNLKPYAKQHVRRVASRVGHCDTTRPRDEFALVVMILVEQAGFQQVCKECHRLCTAG